MAQRPRALLPHAWKYRKARWFLCHYERPEIFLLALWLRLLSAKVYTMGCSKFDDLPRRLVKELLKSLFLAPYHGAIASPGRSHDYFRFLGFSKRPVVTLYNTLSITWMQQQASEAAHPKPDRPRMGDHRPSGAREKPVAGARGACAL